jgi:cytochrome b561
MASHRAGYSTAQVAMHWAVVVLVVFQFVAHDGIEDAWRAFERGTAAPADLKTYLHIGAGVAILLLMLARLYLRLVRGVPEPPQDDPLLIRLVADAIHWGIYGLLIALPLTGATAWFLGVEPAAEIHELLKDILLYAVVLHIGGALFQHFFRRSDVLMRMLMPNRER